MRTIECKRVDLWDGGERHNFGYRIHADITDEAIRKHDPHCMVSKEVITVFDNLQEVDDNSLAKLRKSAWNKLTQQERQALRMEEPK